MSYPSRTFRIFVSSTFSDLKAERNALQEQVFPRLRELCLQHGCRFQAVDLRWGVSEEAALDQQTMKICLEELRRCQEVTPRPNFIVLLGDRYGWRPLPYEIPEAELKEILTRITPAEKDLLCWQDEQPEGQKGWYRRDDNAVPPVYELRHRTGPYVDYKEWQKVEDRLRDILLKAIHGLPLKFADRLKYTASATEQEIVHGGLQVEDAPGHVFCFFRSIDNLPLEDLPLPLAQLKILEDFIDLDHTGHLDLEAQGCLDSLKERLVCCLPDNIHCYEAAWQGDRITTDHLEHFCDDVYQALARVIEAEISQMPATDEVTREREAHLAFGQTRARHFLGRGEILQTIGDYLESDSPHPLAIYAESGSGKSALLAQTVLHAAQNHPEALIVSGFIGATPGSSDIRLLLENLCREISRAYGVREDDLPVEYRKLEDEFPKRLALATPAKPLILVLDALDQLSEAEQAQRLSWLPGILPPHVRFLVSTLPGDYLEGLEKKLPSENLVPLSPMTMEEGGELLDLWLRYDRPEKPRQLQSHQRQEVLVRFAENGLPLYLRLATEEARSWRSYEPPEHIRLRPHIPGVIRDLFRHLADEANHGEVLVSRSLGYLAAGKNGLTEDELMEVLSRDDEVMSDFRRRSPLSPPVDRLPAVVWSRLHFDLAPYLTERAADSTSLLAFYHRQLREVVEADYLSGESKVARHRHLSTYFGDQPLYLVKGQWDSRNVRKVSELPYQETRGELWDDLEKTLCDLRFIEAKCAAGMTYDLVTDYNRTGAGISGPPIRTAWGWQGRFGVECPFCLGRYEVDGQHFGKVISCPGCQEYLRLNSFYLNIIWESRRGLRDVRQRSPEISAPLNPRLQDFYVFVRNQAHILQRHPELTWQQAANQPDGSTLAKAAKWLRNQGEETRPWIEWVNKPQQKSNCLMTLYGHSIGVQGCAFSPDSTTIISVSGSPSALPGELMVWDVRTGNITAHTPFAEDHLMECSFSPDGRRIVATHCTYENEVNIVLLDSETLCEIARTSVRLSYKHNFCLSPEGVILLTGGDDENVSFKVLDLETGNLISEEAEREAPIGLSPDGYYALFRTHDGFIIREAETFRNVVTIPGDVPFAFAPDGLRLVSSLNEDHTSLAIWDIATGRQMATFIGHTHIIETAAYSPDGRYLVSGDSGGKGKVWDTSTGTILGNLEHDDSITHCEFSPNGLTIATASEDKTLKVWEARNLKVADESSHYHRNGENLYMPRFMPDGSKFIAPCRDHTIRVMETASGREINVLAGHRYTVQQLAISLDGRLIISGSHPQTYIKSQEEEASFYELKLWDADTGHKEALTGHTSLLKALTFSPDGARIAGGGEDKTVRLWDVQSQALLAVFQGHKDQVMSLAFSPDGRLIASGDWSGVLIIWDGATGKEIATLAGHQHAVMSCAFSPDGRRVLSSSHDNTLRVWDPEAGIELFTITGQQWQEWEGAAGEYPGVFSPDGQHLAFASQVRTLQIFEVLRGRPILSLSGHRNRLEECHFFPDGRHIATGDWDGLLKVWEAYTGRSVLTFFGNTHCQLDLSCRGDMIASLGGNLHLLRLHGVPLGPPVVTPIRMYLYNTHSWDDDISVRCRWCNTLLAVPEDHLRTQPQGILGAVSKCPQCHQPLKINPFYVDNRDRWLAPSRG